MKKKNIFDCSYYVYFSFVGENKNFDKNKKKMKFKECFCKNNTMTWGQYLLVLETTITIEHDVCKCMPCVFVCQINITVEHNVCKV